MKLLQWKENAEIVALAAVVGTLIAVVYELRQTQEALSAQAYQARAFDAIESNWLLLADRELQGLVSEFQEGTLEIESLEASDLRVLFRFYFIRRTDLDNEHYQYEKGYLDPDFYEATTVPEIKSQAPLWRALGVPEPRRSFSSEVDRILSNQSIAPITVTK